MLGPLVLGPHKGRGRIAGPQPSLESLWQGKHIPLRGKEGLGGYQRKGTPATELLGTDTGLCVTFYTINVNLSGPTHFPRRQQQDPSAGITNLHLHLGFFFSTKTQNILNMKQNSEQVEGLCTATLKGDSNF